MTSSALFPWMYLQKQNRHDRNHACSKKIANYCFTSREPWLSFCFCNDISKFGPNQGRRRRNPSLLFSGQGAQRLDGRGKLTEKSAMHFIPSLFAQAETAEFARANAQTGVQNRAVTGTMTIRMKKMPHELWCVGSVSMAA